MAALLQPRTGLAPKGSGNLDIIVIQPYLLRHFLPFRKPCETEDALIIGTYVCFPLAPVLLGLYARGIDENE
jgi:hypothetical protein